MGDSLFEGMSASVFTKVILMRLADRLRERFPTPGQGDTTRSGGFGYVPAAWPVEGSPIAPQEMIPTYTGTVTKAISGTVGFGLGRRYAQLAAGASVTFKPVRCTGFDIEWAAVVTTGASFAYSVDGGAPVTVSTSSARTTSTQASNVGDTTITVAAVQQDWRPGAMVIIETGGNNETVNIASVAGNVVTLATALTKAHAAGSPVAAHSNGGYLTSVRGLAPGAHTVAITTTTGAFILGVDYYLNDDGKGIHVYNSGHSGIRADQYLTNGATDKWSQSVAVRRPAAIVCDLMINDSGVQTPAQVVANLAALKARIDADVAARGLPRPSWVQVIPYEIDPANNRYQGTPWASYVDAIHGWARTDTTGPGGSSGVFVIDLGRRMPRSDQNVGPYGDPTAYYLASDKIHPLDTGTDAFALWSSRALPIEQ
ncbi:hypothetical protein ACL9RL_09255 [Plantibacter sp. Mn2098]|uniref:hypothetical protein n=1 Tax=Plantibacter sp. Mn2098 TaxID=3395266 RepID=UPI003BC7FD0C